MSDNAAADLLIEIGTEELPPAALMPLVAALGNGLARALDAGRLAHGDCALYATPRRLAVCVTSVGGRQPDRDVEQKGPPVSVAFDADGKPTRAALAFAKKCGVNVDDLGRDSTDRGDWLVHRASEPGRPAAEVLPGCVAAALDELPIPRRMRWGASDATFVRPVHWVVMLHGDRVIPGEVLGMPAGRLTYGHRFMAPDAIELASAGEYASRLADEGYVVADFASRRERIVQAVGASAKDAGGTAVGDAALYDEVTALTEWPVALTGSFDDEFLELPREVIVATLTAHQRYFPVADANGKLMARFVTVANIDSPEPGKVRDGNERVIRPRLADAAFFWNADRRTPLAERQSMLEDVVYQRGLGSLADRSRRVALLASRLAADLGADPALAERAAMLAKCDLVTGMVGEFPELQGTMGRYYALADREPVAVADAIGEHYRPRFAGDALPASELGRVLALADKLDTLCGVFAAGKKPSGNRDPFGLRRAALGAVRIIVEGGLELELPALLHAGIKLQPAKADAGVDDELYDFIVDRLRGWLLERPGYASEMFEAVRSRRPGSLTDFAARVEAVAGFVDNDAAESLAAANKRIANILRQAEFDDPAAVDDARLAEPAERELHDALDDARSRVSPLVASRRYGEALAALAELRVPVDRFFDDVMVMAEDEALRRNRLRLLATLRALFLDIADISRLSIARS